jgi:flagellar biosynthetic protein FliR
MELLLNEPYVYLDAFMLILIRIFGMMLMMPFLSNKNIPSMAKIGMGFFLGVILLNIVPIEISVSSSSPIEFAIVVIKEFITGWLIGFSAYTVFAILTLAGQFIDYQIGFSMVNVFDPMSETQITITGNLYYFVFLLIFLMTRSYFFVFKGLKESFMYIPLGQMTLSTYLYNSFIGFFNDFFLTALQISAPIFFVMLVTNAVLGILARTVPQLNMFVIGFPIKILLGLFVLYATMYLFDNVADIIIDKFIKLMEIFIKGMAP